MYSKVLILFTSTGLVAMIHGLKEQYRFYITITIPAFVTNNNQYGYL